MRHRRQIQNSQFTCNQTKKEREGGEKDWDESGWKEANEGENCQYRVMKVVRVRPTRKEEANAGN